jgi:hypothetical protein|tara:strand:- start:221 stop:469 length:249 start_codon:yes stop_codon:yes gene_type:complete
MSDKNILKEMFDYDEEILNEIYTNNDSNIEKTINCLLEMNQIEELNKTLNKIKLDEENKKINDDNNQFIKLLTSVSNPLQNN